MSKNRIISIIMSFLFVIMTILTSSNTISAKAVTIKPSPIVKKTSITVPAFLVKPLAEYIAGSNVNFKVTSKTALTSTKIQYAVKLFNLGTSKKEMDVSNYGAATIGAKIVSYTFVIKNPGSYRLAVYVKAYGTKGLIGNYYDNYMTNDFKVIKLDKVTKLLKSVNPINATVDARGTFTLPTTVSGKMSDGTLKQYGVAWNKKVSTTTPGAFNFIGTLKDLSTATLIKTVKAKLTLKVNALPVFTPITVVVEANSIYVLPTTVNGKTFDGSINKFGVTWNKPASTTTPGAFNFVGTIKSTTTAAIIKNVNAKLTLKVNALPKFDSIVASVNERSEYTLPVTVDGKMADGTVKQFGVNWDKQASTITPGTFTFIGAIKDLNTNTTMENVGVVLTLTVNSIPTIDALSANVTEGTDYVLPPAVSGKMSDGTVIVYNVDWDRPADTTKAGVYTFVGALKDANTATLIPNISARFTLNVNPLPLQVSVNALNSKAFRIVFNKSVDISNCKITTSMNSISIPLTTAWESDGKSVLLQSENDLAIGTYVIEISGIGLTTDSYTVDIAGATLTSISIPTIYVTPNNASAKVLVSGKDQYGQSLNAVTTDFMWIVTDTTTVPQLVLPVTTTSFNYFTIQTNLPGVKNGDKLSVYCIGKSNGINTTGSLEINTKPIDSIVLSQPTIPTGDKRLTVKSTATYYEIPYDAIQNYIVNGTTTKSSAVLDDKIETPLGQTVTLNNFIFSTDRSDVLPNIKVENGKLYVQIGANKSGSVKLTATEIPQAGQTIAQNINTLVLNIAGPSIPDSLTIGTTSSVLVNGGSALKLPISVIDQYGEVITPDGFVRTNFTDFTILSSNSSVANASFGYDGMTLDITPSSIGSANITVVNKNSGKAVIYNATVKAASAVSGFISSVDYNSVVRGAVANLKIDTLDQYGNKLLSVPATYKYMVVANNGGANVKVSATNVTVNTLLVTPITLTGVTSGKTEVITITLYNDLNNNNILDPTETIGTSLAFNINVIADNEQLIYSPNAINNTYAAVSQDRSNTGLNQDAYGAIQNQNNKNLLYTQKITLKATRAVDGTAVALINNPINSIAATVNPETIDYLGKVGNDFVIVGRQWSGTELTKDANLLVNYTDNTGVIRTLNAKVTISKESLKATKLKFMVNNGKDSDTSNDSELSGIVTTIPLADFNGLDGKKLIENQNLTGYPFYFEVDDQYGVSSINPMSIAVVGKQTMIGLFTIDANNVISTSRFTSGDSVTLNATDTEGHTLVITIKIQ